MEKKQQEQKKSFVVIREGFARARFGGALNGCQVPEGFSPISFAPVENNAGLDPAEFYVTNARLLSKAVTPYRKFDFTTGNVLRDAVPLFEGLTLYANHYPDVNNWKGRLQGSVWDEASTPNGINSLIIADRVVDSKLARGLETKALRSLSVTIWFEFTKSHPDLANFYDRLGEEIDGELVRLIVTRITNAGEVSVVWEGEDPYAKTFEAGCEEPAQPTKEESDVKLSATTMTLLGIAAGTELTESLLEEKIGEKVNTLNVRIAELEPDAKLGKQLLTDTREKATTLYKTAKGEKFQQAFIDGVINQADLTTARALCQEYEEEVDKTIPLKCTKCGEPLSRRSSRQEEPGHFGGEGKRKRVDDYKV